MGFSKRLFVGLLMYAIGIFWSCIAVPLFFLGCLKHGIKGFQSIFKRGKFDVLPEIARSPNYNHGYLTTISGMKFHYVYEGTKDRPLMLCMHGFPECWYSWRHILKQFSKDYYVVAFDLRGYGGSDKPKNIGDYHISYLVRDVNEIVHALGYEKVILLGHDWGGAIAWETPLYYPDLVEKLVVMNGPMIKGMQDFTKSYPSQLLKSWYIFYFQIPYLADFQLKSDECRLIGSAFNGKSGLRNKKNHLTDEQISVYKHYVAPNLTYAINFYRAGNPIYQGLKLKKKKNKIEIPTLLIWGDNDSALDFRMIPFFKKYVKDLQVKMIEGASHWVGLDDPVEVESAIRKFL